jgi:hypothetical protein
MKPGKRALIPILILMATAVLFIFIFFVKIPFERTVPDESLESRLGYGMKEEIVFDQSYTQASSPYDTGFAGMSTLTAHLRKQGIAVSVNFKPLDVLLKKFRGPGHVLVLGVPTVLPAEYREADKEAIRFFVSSGGGLMLIVEHDNAYNNHNFQRPLLASYGVGVNVENAFGAMESVDGTNWPVSNSLPWRFTNIKYYYAASLNVGNGTEIFTQVNRPLSREHAINGAINLKQNGPVVVLGDYEIFWNMTPESGIRYGDNMAFIMRTFELLLNRHKQKKINTCVVPTDIRLSKRGSQGVVLFSSHGAGLAPDRSIAGLFGFAKKLNDAGYRIAIDDTSNGSDAYDCLVLACPVTAVGDMADTVKARRLLLICDGLSSAMEADESMKLFIAATARDYGLRYNVREYDHPLNPVTARLGFVFYPATVLTDTSPNQYEASARWADIGTEFTLRRSCVITPARGEFPSDLHILARTGDESWPGKNPFAVFIAPGIVRRYSPGPELRGSRSVVVSSPRVFALSDAELLGNQFINTQEAGELVRRIIEWLKRGE